MYTYTHTHASLLSRAFRAVEGVQGSSAREDALRSRLRVDQKGALAKGGGCFRQLEQLR